LDIFNIFERLDRLSQPSIILGLMQAMRFHFHNFLTDIEEMKGLVQGERSDMQLLEREIMHLLKKIIIGGSVLFAAASNAKAFELVSEHVSNQLIVKFDNSVAKQSIEAILADKGARVVTTFRASGAMLIEYTEKGGAMLLESRANSLLKNTDVKYVESNDIIRIDRLPNDADFSKLYGLHNEGGTGGTVDADIDAAEAWDITTGSKDVVVGIIDTGVDYTHPDIAPNYWTNPGETGTDAQGNDMQTNGIDDDNNGFVDDFRGWDFANGDNDPIDDHDHGTHCAGTIGAAGNDGVGVVGVNWNVSMVGIKFLTGSGSGTTAHAIQSIEYGTTLGLTLTSNSWGGGGFSQPMKDAIEEANSADVLFIAAAGNSGANNDSNPHYPSTYDNDNIIAVAATDHNDGRASFSCYGLNSVDLGAPGKDIYSTTKGGTYSSFSGTSMATPHVSGVIALVKAQFPDATGAELKSRVMNTADPVSSLSGKTVTGGRINAASALENDTLAPNAPSDILVASAGLTTVSLSWFAAGDDGAQGVARRYEVRKSENPIRNPGDWDNADTVDAAVVITPGRTAVTGQLVGLPFNSEGFIAIRAFDNVGNVGPVSATVAFATQRVAVVSENNAESMDGVTASGTWGLQEAPARSGFSFSDSPEGDYAENSDYSLTLAPFTADNSDITMVFQTKYDLENGYDFVTVDLSKDGTTWVELDKLTGTEGSWTSKQYDLSTHVSAGDNITIRFHIVSDYSIQKDGIQIDDIQLFGPAK
jgi:subtilisin family serine protease